MGKKNFKIYILCPHGLRTGGPEALHQLFHSLKSLDLEVYMAYVSLKKRIFRPLPEINYHSSSIFEYYNKYEPISCNEIEDREDSVVIFPETWRSLTFKFKNLKKVIWWLSVDNFFSAHQKFKYLKKVIRWLSVDNFFLAHQNGSDNKKVFKFDISNSDIMNLFQSHYAEHFLIQNNAFNLIPLFDYINIDQVIKKEKEDIICYNPKKGFQVTKQIIDVLKDEYKFIALENMTTSELSETLSKSKIYIDFGNHPGKDRMPREAALLDNIIITSKRGAAFFQADTPIPESFKFYDYEIKEICEKIKMSMVSYKDTIGEFQEYKNIISNQKNEFNNQANEFYKKIGECFFKTERVLSK